jgi:radical SAM modification target selenobiotic family peptide
VVSAFSLFSLFYEEVNPMISKDMKKFLAGLGVAGLISAGGISIPGAQAGSSG